MERFGCVAVALQCFQTNKFDAQGPGWIMKQETARSQSHAFERCRLLNFVDYSCLLHAKLCHGRARTAILNICNVIGALGHGLPIARSWIWMRCLIQKILRKQSIFCIFDIFEEEPKIEKATVKLYSSVLGQQLLKPVASVVQSALWSGIKGGF